MIDEASPSPDPRIRRVRRILNGWCWYVFGLFLLGFLCRATAESSNVIGVLGFGAFWLLVFGGYAARSGGLLDRSAGHQKAALVMAGITLISVFMVLRGLGLFRVFETPRNQAAVLAPIWYQALRVGLVVFSARVTVELVLIARRPGEAWYLALWPVPSETWPPCRPDRRRGASIATLVLAALFIIAAILGLAGVFGGDPADVESWLVLGVVYGGVTLLAGIQMWFGRWVAITVGVLVPLCMLAAIIFTTVGFAGYIPPAVAIPGAIGAAVCTIFLIRGVTCRPAM